MLFFVFVVGGWVFVCLQLSTTLLQEMPPSTKIPDILLHTHNKLRSLPRPYEKLPEGKENSFSLFWSYNCHETRSSSTVP